ncbi:MAG: transposase [Pirellulales bacterium]
MSKPETLSFRRRHLPHWMVDDKPYFVTFRLKGSLPEEVAERMRLERDELLRSGADEATMLDCRRRQFVRMESILDAAKDSPMHLANPAIAKMVFDAFDWLEEQRGWEVFAAVIMPNHVHALLQNFAGRNDALSTDLGVVKGYTARLANQILQTKDAFWQDENFDHWIRDAEKFEATIRYIKQNPVKAGLCVNWRDWRWTRVK